MSQALLQYENARPKCPECSSNLVEFTGRYSIRVSAELCSNEECGYVKSNIWEA
jgi:hypothetical protein